MFGGGQGAGAQPAWKILIFELARVETVFFYVLNFRNDPISYVKQFLDPLYVFFTLFGCWRRDGWGGF